MLVLRVDRTEHEGVELLPLRGADWRKGLMYRQGIAADLHPHGAEQTCFLITRTKWIERSHRA